MLKKEEVKKWMKENKKDRYWLAELCKTGKRAVDKWFEVKNDFPPKAILILQEHMKATKENEPEEKGGYTFFDVKLPADQYEYVRAAARKNNQTVAERFAYLIQEDIKEYARSLEEEQRKSLSEEENPKDKKE